jgi:hypothetical protein
MELLLNNNDKFQFRGHRCSHLDTITENSFVMSLYHESDTYYEYDFDGNFINKYTRDEYDKMYPYTYGKDEWYIKKINRNAFKNVIEIYNETYEWTFNGDEYDNPDDFSEIIDKIDPMTKYKEKNLWTFGKYKLTRTAVSNYKNVFVIENKNKIISLMHDEFSDGDCGTHVFLLNKKNILLWNDGDCPSVLFIENLIDENNSDYYQPPKKTFELLKSMTEYYDLFKNHLYHYIKNCIPDETIELTMDDESECTYYLHKEGTSLCDIEFEDGCLILTDETIIEKFYISHPDLNPININKFISDSVIRHAK